MRPWLTADSRPPAKERNALLEARRDVVDHCCPSPMRRGSPLCLAHLATPHSASPQVDHMISERSILIGLNHPFIVNLATTFQDPRYLYMVLEYVQVRCMGPACLITEPLKASSSPGITHACRTIQHHRHHQHCHPARHSYHSRPNHSLLHAHTHAHRREASYSRISAKRAASTTPRLSSTRRVWCRFLNTCTSRT